MFFFIKYDANTISSKRNQTFALEENITINTFQIKTICLNFIKIHEKLVQIYNAHNILYTLI